MQALYLFQTGNFEKAMTLFQELGVNPTVVISLYPPVISGHAASVTIENSIPLGIALYPFFHQIEYV